MHTSFNYTFTTAAEEISAWLSGEMPSAMAISHGAKHRSKEVQAFDHEKNLHYFRFYNFDRATGNLYIDDQQFRHLLIDSAKIVPNVGKPMLMLDVKARFQAAREVNDYIRNGAYVDRGLDINGRPVQREDD